MSLEFITVAERPNLEDRLTEVIVSAWPPFMLNDPVAGRHWARLFRDFPEYQLVLLEGETIAGAANAVPFA